MSTARRPALLWVLIALLTLEFLAVLAITILIVILNFTSTPGSFGAGVALAVVALVATAWLGAMVVGVVRGQAWIRAGAFVWQVLQLAIGVGALQGGFSQEVSGWPLIIVALAVAALLFTKPVVAATTARGELP